MSLTDAIARIESQKARSEDFLLSQDFDTLAQVTKQQGIIEGLQKALVEVKELQVKLGEPG